jgi:hypothetical protein
MTKSPKAAPQAAAKAPTDAMLLNAAAIALFGADIDPAELRDHMKLPARVWRDIMRDKMHLQDVAFDKLHDDINDRIVELMRVRDDIAARQVRRRQTRPRTKVKTRLNCPDSEFEQL